MHLYHLIARYAPAELEGGSFKKGHVPIGRENTNIPRPTPTHLFGRADCGGRPGARAAWLEWHYALELALLHWPLVLCRQISDTCAKTISKHYAARMPFELYLCYQLLSFLSVSISSFLCFFAHCLSVSLLSLSLALCLARSPSLSLSLSLSLCLFPFSLSCFLSFCLSFLP